MFRVLAAFCLFSGLATAYDPSTIVAAKLHAGGQAGFPCRLQGAVTMRPSPTEFYLQDNTSGVRVISNPYALKVGQRLEVAGWMYLADSGELQVRAREVWNVAEGIPLAPRPISIAAALQGAYQGQLVALRGTVLNVDFGTRFDVLSLQSGRNSVRVFYPGNPGGLSVFEKIYPGMEVAVTGISVPQTAYPENDGYQLRLRAPSDLHLQSGSERSSSFPKILSIEWLAACLALLAIGAVCTTVLLHRQHPASQVQ